MPSSGETAEPQHVLRERTCGRASGAYNQVPQ